MGSVTFELGADGILVALMNLPGRPMNVVHRDVSPSNIIVTYQGTVKLVDFGIATCPDWTCQRRITWATVRS